jgi:hypothetical protein
VNKGDPLREATTVRDVIRLLFEADSYPRIATDDWATAARMEAAALQKAETALASPDDPPEFTRWLAALQRPALSGNEREKIYDAIHDLFTAGGCSGLSTIGDM